MPRETIASGEVELGINDSALIAGLDRAKAKFERTMKEIDREHAEATADINMSKLDQKVANAKRKLRELEGQAVEVDLEADDTGLKEKLAAARAAVKKADGEKATFELKLKGDDKVKAQLAAVEAAEKKRADAVSAQERAIDKEREAFSRRNAARVNREARVSSSLNAQREREYNTAHTMALRMEQDARRAEVQRQKELASIPRLQRAYVEAAQDVERLAATRAKLSKSVGGDQKAKLVVDLKYAEAAAKVKTLKETLERLGSPIDLKVHLDTPAAEFGRMLRSIRNDRGTIAAAHLAGLTLGDSIVNGVRSKLNPVNLFAGFERGAGNFFKRFENLSDATIRLGPFTTSIAGAIRGLSLLAPIIVDVVGALGSLVSVAGAAAAGVGALGVGLIGGAIPALVGMVAVLKPVVGELKNAFTASAAYNKAVLQYGASSDQAAAKQKILNNTLKGASAETRQAFKDAGTLSQRWKDLTSPARANAFHVVGQGIQFASTSLGMMGRNTNELFATLDRSFSRIFKGLGSREGQNILGTMFGNFNQTLGPVLDGLANVGVYLGRVGKIASSFGPGLGRTFREWSQGLADSAKDSDALYGRIQRLMNAAKSVGNFFLAAGRFIKAFFNPGVEAGQSFVDTMTAALNRWTAFLQTTRGRNNLAEFFNQSVKGAEALYSLLAPILSAFVGWATALAPFARIFFQASGYVASLLQGLLRITALRGPFSALAATFGVMFAINRISAATAALGQFARALAGVRVAEEGVAAANVAGGISSVGAGVASGAAGRGAAGRVVGAAEGAAIGGVAANAGKAEGALVKAAGGAALFRGAIGGVFRTIGLGNPYIGAGVVALGAMAYVLHNTSTVAKRTQEAFTNAGKASDNAAKFYRANSTTLADLASQQGHANEALKQAKTQLDSTKKGTDAHRQALLNYRDAQRQAIKSTNDYKTASTQETDAANAQVKASYDQLKAFDKRTKSIKDKIEQQKKSALTEEGEREAEQKLQNIENKRAPLLDKVSAALNRQAAANLNVTRGAAGMLPVLGKAEQQLGALARSAKGASVATKISMKFAAPQDVGKVAASASASLKAGVSSKIVTKIVADSSDADQAIARLKAARIPDKQLNILMKGGDAAVALLEKIAGRKLTAKELHIAEKGGTDVLGIIARIQARKLAAKNQRLAQSGGERVISVIGNIIKLKIGNKSFSIHADDSQAQQVMASLRNMTLPPITQQILQRVVSAGGRPRQVHGGVAGQAMGGMVTPAMKRMANIDGIPGVPKLDSYASRRGGKVNRPTLLTGEERRNEFVIATNPAYKKANISYLMQAARALGVQTAAKGKGKHRTTTNKVIHRDNSKLSLTAHGQARQRAVARRRVDKQTIKNPGNYPEIDRVHNLQQQETDANRNISIAESKLKEPDTFLTKIGTDDQGNDLYAIDQGAVAQWAGQLDNMRKMYDQLIAIISAIGPAVANAIKAITQTTTTATHNLHVLAGLENREHRIINGKHTSKSEKDAAKNRLKVYKAAADEEHKKVSDARDSRTDLLAEQHDYPFRIQEAQVQRDNYAADRDAVLGKAEDDLLAANPQPKAPEAVIPPGPFDALQSQDAAIGAELALAQIGQGIGGQPARSIQDILASDNSIQQQIINTATGLLHDADPTNDADAYSAIQSAAGTIGSNNSQISDITGAGAAANMGLQIAALSGARQDLLNSFGSNFSVAAGFGATSQAFSGRGAFGINPAMVMPGPTGQGGSGFAGKMVNVQNVNLNTPIAPTDPHTFSKGLAYELGAL